MKCGPHTSLRQRVACSFLLLLLTGCQKATEQRQTATPITTEPAPQWVTDEESDPFKEEDAEASSPPPLQTEAPLETVYRPDDTRVVSNEDNLLQFGIRKYESKRLILYSDIDPNVAATLPPVVDQAYDALVDYFGELPPARSGADFQMTGYLIGNRDLFLSAGLIPSDLNRFDHGQHRGQEFWFYEQEFDYYRRHLLIHEVTHCFTMIIPGIRPPLWYLEGMAEFFATHQVQPNGKIEFGVMPANSSEFRGFGRIEIIQEEVTAGRILNVDAASRLGVNEFANSRSTPYAWSWALCHFLDSHPRYQDRFRMLSNHLVGTEFQRLADTLFADDKLLLAAEWDQFIQRCEYGWDFAANAFVLTDLMHRPLREQVVSQVQANQGWQSTGLRVVTGQEYSITATGRVTLAETPRPWISEAQGISIDYVNGKPLGRIEAGVLIEPDQNAEVISKIFEVQDCGPQATIRFQKSGLLMFQVNDHASKRNDNSGAFQIRVELVK